MDIIKSSAEISDLFSRGRRIYTPHITLIVSQKECDRLDASSSGRVAFIAGKKHGNAVWRNASKRRMRAIYQELDPHFSQVDALFVAKANLLKAPYSQVLEECQAIIERIG